MSIYTLNGNERVLSQQSFLVSETDEKGIIVFANDDFCQAAGYHIDELIGKSHNIVRHPDMPKAAFKDLWETIKRGETWNGFVKNAVKNSSEYYWVYATVFPVLRNGKRSYISCRKKPVADEIASSIALYKTLV